MAINLDVMLINIVVSTVIISPALWLSGRLIMGGRKVRLFNAVLIVLFGTVLGGLFGAFFSGIIASIIQLVLWLALIRHYFECGWWTALGIAIIAVIIFVLISSILGVVGYTLFKSFI